MAGYVSTGNDNVTVWMWKATEQATINDLVGEVTGVSDVTDGERDKHETTHFGSKIKTHVYGLGDPGDWEITQNMTKDSLDKMEALKQAGGLCRIAMVWKDEDGETVATRQNTCRIGNIAITDNSINGKINVKTSLTLQDAWTSDFVEPTEAT